MRIGLLETDILYDEFIKEYGSYGLMFEQYFTQLEGNNVQSSDLEFVYYQVQQGEFPVFLDECDAYVVTGSKAGAYEDHDWIEALSNWIIEADKAETKLLGVCFGHQIIAQALGGKVEKSDKGWGVGVRSLLTIPDSPFCQSLPKYLDLIYSHKDQVVKLPPMARNFLGDDFCPYAGFTIGEHIVTLQGHPEFNAEYSERLLARRANDIEESVYIQALHSLKLGTDANYIGRLILDFLSPVKTQLDNDNQIESLQVSDKAEKTDESLEAAKPLEIEGAE